MNFGVRIVFWFLAFTLLLQPAWRFSSSNSAYAFHFPWDQGHDTFDPDPGDEDTDPGPGGQCKLGSPLEVATGNFIYSTQDLLIPALGPDIGVVRTYNSRDMRNGSFGHGWVFTYDTRLVETTDGVLLSAICRQEDGRRERFAKNANGTFTSPSHLFSTLVKNANETFTLTEKDGTTHRFDVDGRLTATADRNGNTMTFTYDATGFLTSVRDASGRTLSFTKGANGKIANITDPAGRVLRYTYDLEGNLETSSDFLGNITRYVYDAKHNLLQVIDPKGNTVQNVIYDTSDRVTTFIQYFGHFLSERV